jgi:hypothetical protein
MAHCGLQNPSKPLRFIAAMFGRFARKGKTINIEAPSTNLGVRSSNLFGRAKQYIDITIDYQFANSAFPAFTIYIATVSPRLATGVQVTLWQLSREKSLIAKRCEMKGNSGHTSKANFGSAFVSSNPPTPANQCGLSYSISGCSRTADIPAGYAGVHESLAGKFRTFGSGLVALAAPVSARHFPISVSECPRPVRH